MICHLSCREEMKGESEMTVRYDLNHDVKDGECTFCGAEVRCKTKPYIHWTDVEKCPDNVMRICGDCVQRIAVPLRLDFIEASAAIDMNEAGASYQIQLSRKILR